jgi:hypothetical protein
MSVPFCLGAKRSGGQLFCCACIEPFSVIVLSHTSCSTSFCFRLLRAPQLYATAAHPPSPARPRLLPFSRALLLPSRPRATGAVLHLVSLGVQHEERGRRLRPSYCNRVPPNHLLPAAVSCVMEWLGWRVLVSFGGFYVLFFFSPCSSHVLVFSFCVSLTGSYVRRTDLDRRSPLHSPVVREVCFLPFFGQRLL